MIQETTRSWCHYQKYLNNFCRQHFTLTTNDKGTFIKGWIHCSTILLMHSVFIVMVVEKNNAWLNIQTTYHNHISSHVHTRSVGRQILSTNMNGNGWCKSPKNFIRCINHIPCFIRMSVISSFWIPCIVPDVLKNVKKKISNIIKKIMISGQVTDSWLHSLSHSWINVD